MGSPRKQKRRLLAWQKPQFSYTLQTDHPALFVEMRLGKTLVTIRRNLLYKPRGEHLRVLVVAPSSALGSWERELTMEGEDDYTYLIGTKKNRQELLAEDHSWNLINKEGYMALPEIADVPWDSVIMDESTTLKNPKAKVTKFFLQNFRSVPHRWALTGLPNPESDMEFWTQLAWLDGRAFKSKTFWHFRSNYFEQRWGSLKWSPQPHTQTFIRNEVAKRACVLRRKDVGVDLEKVYQTREFDLPKKLRDTYEMVEDEFILEYEGTEKKTLSSLARHTWLWRMCGGVIDEEMVWEDKVKEISYLLKNDLANEQVIIWFVFNLEIEAVLDALYFKDGISCRAITGKTPILNRHQMVKEFQEGKFKVLLLQEKIARTGMDLSASDTNIIYSSPVGFEARAQMEDRTINPLKKRPVLFIDLVVKDSVDADLRNALLDKSAKSDLTLSRAVALGMEHRAQKRKAG